MLFRSPAVVAVLVAQAMLEVRSLPQRTVVSDWHRRLVVRLSLVRAAVLVLVVLVAAAAAVMVELVRQQVA